MGRKEGMEIMGILRIGALLLTAALLGSCGANMFACSTDVNYEVDTVNKITKGSYSSCKEQNGFKAEIDPKTGYAKVETERAFTQESVVAAALQMGLMNNQLLQQLIKQVNEMALKVAPLAAGS